MFLNKDFMKKIPFLLILIFSCNSIEKNIKKEERTEKLLKLDNDSSIISSHDLKQDFIISESFVEADNETFLSLLIDAQSLVNLTSQEKEDNLMRWKKTVKILVNKNDFAENIVISKSELPPNQYTLDLFNSQLDSQASQLLNSNIEMKLIESGFGKFNNLLDYIFIKSKMVFDGVSRYSCQYIITLNNNNYHIVINTFDGYVINDIFKEINQFKF